MDYLWGGGVGKELAGVKNDLEEGGVLSQETENVGVVGGGG